MEKTGLGLLASAVALLSMLAACGGRIVGGGSSGGDRDGGSAKDGARDSGALDASGDASTSSCVHAALTSGVHASCGTCITTACADELAEYEVGCAPYVECTCPDGSYTQDAAVFNACALMVTTDCASANQTLAACIARSACTSACDHKIPPLAACTELAACCDNLPPGEIGACMGLAGTGEERSCADTYWDYNCS
jgi:hypothetical protein